MRWKCNCTPMIFYVPGVIFMLHCDHSDPFSQKNTIFVVFSFLNSHVPLESKRAEFSKTWKITPGCYPIFASGGETQGYKCHYFRVFQQHWRLCNRGKMSTRFFFSFWFNYLPWVLSPPQQIYWALEVEYWHVYPAGQVVAPNPGVQDWGRPVFPNM